MKTQSQPAPTQAIPARRTQVGDFSSLPINVGGTYVPFDQCTNELKSALTEALVNARPRRYLIVDPATDISVVVSGHVLSTSAIPKGGGYIFVLPFPPFL